MSVFKKGHRGVAFLFLPLLMGCQVGYLIKSGYHQAKILASRIDIDEALRSSDLTEEERQRLLLVKDIKVFSETRLGLKKNRNYLTYVRLDRPYVSYVLSAAPQFQLKAHLWGYPLVGELPYRGYFDESEARAEAHKMDADGFDTLVRGVSAYSTLGYFDDPVLSSMIRYQNHEFVDLIIHESVHATLYIKSSADFNERLATFLGNRGVEAYYREKEGVDAKTLALITAENEDERVFSAFISQEISNLRQWYEVNQDVNADTKKEKLAQIVERFHKGIKPKLKSDRYLRFGEGSLNNAQLLLYDTYVTDLSDFEKLYEIEGRDFKRMMARLKTLEGMDSPEEILREWVR